MNCSVNIFGDNVGVRKAFAEELSKAGIASHTDFGFRKGDVTLLLHDAKLGMNPQFEKLSKKLIKLNIRPILVLTNVKQEDADHVERACDEIYASWQKIDSQIEPYSAKAFFYDGERFVFPYSEPGISRLVNFIKALPGQMKFHQD